MPELTKENMLASLQANLLDRAGVIAGRVKLEGDALGALKEKTDDDMTAKKGPIKAGENEVAIVGIICLDEFADLYEMVFGPEMVCSPKKVAEAFAKCDGDVMLRIDSYGGYVKGASKICNIINQYAKDNKAKVNGVIEGWSASASTLIQMQTDHLEIAEFAEVMIHRSSSVAMGTTHDMAKAAKYMAGRDEMFAKAYADKSGKDPKEMLKLMDAETWFSAQEAVDVGLVDAVAAKRDDEEMEKGDDDDDEKMAEGAIGRAQNVVKMLMAEE